MVAAERSPEPLTRAAVARQAWPIILANAAVPALGLVDTAVIGHYGSATGLGALALGALLFNFVYWSFGFLRMGTTGFVAQARGAGDEAEVRATFARALLLGAGIGAALLVLQWPLTWLYFGLMDGSDAVESVAGEYFRARIWGAPAALALFAVSGLLIGLGRSRELLLVQLLLNGLNAGLDVWFAGMLGMGARGIGLGTAIAEWGTCAVALVVALRVLRWRHRDPAPLLDWRRVADPQRIREAMAANGDILVRTLCLLLVGVVNVWAFPVYGFWVIAGFFLLVFVCAFLLLRVRLTLPKMVAGSVVTSLLVFYLLNSNFYPQLLQYQAGNELAFATRGKVDAKNVYFQPGLYSSSYVFYTAELRKEFHDSVLQQPGPVWLMTDGDLLQQIKPPVLQTYEHVDYEITRMQLPFVNPATRKKELTKLLLVRIK